MIPTSIYVYTVGFVRVSDGIVGNIGFMVNNRDLLSALCVSIISPAA